MLAESHLNRQRFATMLGRIAPLPVPGGGPVQVGQNRQQAALSVRIAGCWGALRTKARKPGENRLQILEAGKMGVQSAPLESKGRFWLRALDMHVGVVGPMG